MAENLQNVSTISKAFQKSLRNCQNEANVKKIFIMYQNWKFLSCFRNTSVVDNDPNQLHTLSLITASLMETAGQCFYSHTNG